VIYVAVLLSTAVLVYGYRWLALSRHWFDVPNARSSHRELVPRGAGIVFVFTIVMGLMAIYGLERERAFVASLLIGVGVAAVGLWDDLRGLSARIRFVIYGVLCLASILCVLQRDPIGLTQVLTILSAAIALLWCLNLYNFMDGINGLATLEGVFLMSAALLLTASSSGVEHELYIVILAALAGFLFWNFPRAFVFMGDAGSSFLGFLVGVIALWSIHAGTMTLWQWLILGGGFIVDATYTLSIRVITGQRWHEAHRSHAYQRLADLCNSHVWAVFWLMAINIIWLLPVAALSIRYGRQPFLWLVYAYTPLVLGCYYLKAGLDKRNEMH
jgi:Fuc2NAc and GlcNAc transferase